MKIQNIFADVADLFLKPYKKRDANELRLTSCGICYVLKVMINENNTRPTPYQYMDQIQPGKWLAYRGEVTSKTSKKYDDARAFFCLFMSELPKEDFNEIWKI